MKWNIVILYFGDFKLISVNFSNCLSLCSDPNTKSFAISTNDNAPVFFLWICSTIVWFNLICVIFVPKYVYNLLKTLKHLLLVAIVAGFTIINWNSFTTSDNKSFCPLVNFFTSLRMSRNFSYFLLVGREWGNVFNWASRVDRWKSSW